MELVGSVERFVWPLAHFLIQLAFEGLSSQLCSSCLFSNAQRCSLQVSHTCAEKWAV
nr:MAG TPA: hypothetical protein [Caudoviricetes sp.]